MSLGKIGAVALAIVYVAALAVLVSHTQTANIIRAFGDAFTGALGAVTKVGTA